MVLRVSATAARVVATSAFVIRPNPSATTFSRLEPLPTSDDPAESLQARIADPLWMLARQWQFNELQGEDAGSPIAASLAVHGVPVTSLVSLDGSVPPHALTDDTPPVEALVEHEQVLDAHPKLNAQAGQHLMRVLRGAGLGALLPSILENYAAALERPKDPVADNAGFVWNALLHGKAVDASKFAADLPGVEDAAAYAAFATALGVGNAQMSAWQKAVEGWRRWLRELALGASTPGASPYWNPQRLEYAFALQADGPQPPLRLEAEEYTDGNLDWHTFSVAASGTAPPLGADPTVVVPERPPLPTIARYPGMPADRYWEFEDGRVNFGMLGAAKSDLARLAVLEYALVFGNDWFLLPLTLPVNALYKVAELSVRDNFGISVAIPPARNPDGSQWTMFEMSVKAGSAPRARLDDILYLCPSVDTLEGPPLEHVLLMRDEMANMVWGIEKRVQGTSGEPLDRKFESNRLSTNQVLRPPKDFVPPPGAPLHYRMQTPVAAHWIPFLPVKKQGATIANWQIQLQRGVVNQFYQVQASRLADPRNREYAQFIARLNEASFVERQVEPPTADLELQGFMFHPRGSILRAVPDPLASVKDDYLRLEEEEVPRDGAEVKRAFNYARDAKGRAVMWIGRSKRTGRGEGSSGLRFDVVERGKRSA
jgi:hypothetical protein